MKVRLVGDVGGTSADWALIGVKGVQVFSTIGYNPSSQSDRRLLKMCQEVRSKLISDHPSDLLYFGAGTSYPGACENIQKSFLQYLHLKKIDVQSDLLGAALALCGDESGVVAILGTGSNVCHYDGQKIDIFGISLGFPLGDEGGGVDIGSRLVKDFYYGILPTELKLILRDHLPPDPGEFLKRIKSSTAPNQMLASYVRLLSDYRDHYHVQGIVKAAFRNFCHCHLQRFKTYHKINFAGSIAFYFCRELEQILGESGFKMGNLEKSPIEALAAYYGRNKT